MKGINFKVFFTRKKVSGSITYDKIPLLNISGNRTIVLSIRFTVDKEKNNEKYSDLYAGIIGNFNSC